MPPYQARSNACRSGVTRAGWSTRGLVCKIGGVTRGIDAQQMTINESFSLSTPTTCNFQTVGGYQVNGGEELIIGAGHIDNRMFGGHLVKVAADLSSGVADMAATVYQCVAQDYSWILNLDDVVFGAYDNVGVSSVLGDILYRFTDGTFRPGQCASSLGNVTIQYDGVTVLAALERLAGSVGASAFIDYSRRVSILASRTDGNPLTVTSATQLEDLFWSRDMSQIRNRVLFLTGGNNLAGFAPAGQTQLFLENGSWESWYSPAGGTVLAGSQLITYTSAAPLVTYVKVDGISYIETTYCVLYGCTGVVRDIPAGTRVRGVAISSDSARQTALATLLGGGSAGVATVLVGSENVSISEALARAAATVTQKGDPADTVRFTVKDADRYQVGKTVAMDFTAAPTQRSFSGDFVIQQIIISADHDGVPTDGAIVWRRQVLAARYVENLIGLLQRLARMER